MTLPPPRPIPPPLAGARDPGDDVDALAAQAAEARAAAYAAPELAAIAPYVDLAYYRGVYPDIGRTDLDPVAHYHRFGWREGRRPNAWFDPQYYLAAYPDIAAVGMEPLEHYVKHGRAEGRAPSRPGGVWRDIAEAARAPLERPTGDDAPAGAPVRDAGFTAARLAAALAGMRGLVLSASHDRYIDTVGGVQIFIADEQELFNGDLFAYLQVSPAVARLTLAPEGDDELLLQLVLDGRFIGLAPHSALLAALRGLPAGLAPVRLFVVHSLFGHRASVLAELARAVGAAEKFFWLHDYATLCEGYNLLRDDVQFCHAPPPESMACRVCVYGAGRTAYRARVRGLFAEMGFHVLAPSAVALELWRRTAELPHESARVHANCLVVPDDSAPVGRAAEGPVNVAFVGYPAGSKGWPIYHELVQTLRVMPDYRFHHFVIRSSVQPMDGLLSVPTTVDRFDRFAMVRALRAHAIDLVVAVSPWPETFSFVAHEAFAAGADVVTLEGSGNVAAAVRLHRRGVVLRDAAALMAFFRGRQAVRYVRALAAAGRGGVSLLALGTTATVDFGARTGPDAARVETGDPDLVVLGPGGVVRPERVDDAYIFALPADVASVRLLSRSVVPAARRPVEAEARRLGVWVRTLLLDGEEVPADDARRADGWHEAEGGMQWTSGDATVLTGGARRMEIHVQPVLNYVRVPLAGDATA